jgi:hypothetical protein
MTPVTSKNLYNLQPLPRELQVVPFQGLHELISYFLRGHTTIPHVLSGTIPVFMLP